MNQSIKTGLMAGMVMLIFFGIAEASVINLWMGGSVEGSNRLGTVSDAYSGPAFTGTSFNEVDISLTQTVNDPYFENSSALWLERRGDVFHGHQSAYLSNMAAQAELHLDWEFDVSGGGTTMWIGLDREGIGSSSISLYNRTTDTMLGDLNVTDTWGGYRINDLELIDGHSYRLRATAMIPERYSGDPQGYFEFEFDDATFNSVPLPTSILLLGPSLLALVGIRRKIKK